MTNLDDCICLDIESGTFFSASNAHILDTRKLTEAELDLLNNGSDCDRSDLAAAHGQELSHWSPPADRQALDAAAALLNAEQWSSDHLNAVADLVRATGRSIADL